MTFSFSYLSADVTPIVDATPIHEAFVPKFTDVMPNTYLSKSPPAPINELIPEKPTDDVIWIPGYWAWIDSKQDFAWVCGVWRRPPPDHYWISGKWYKMNKGWVWAKGFWSPKPEEELAYIKKEPPKSANDDIPDAPGENYFWIPGYWDYSSATKKFSWISGKWEEFSENWILAPATYIWRPSGYVFVPMYWDWILDDRGYAYSCLEQQDEPPVVLQPEIIIRQLFFYYPDYVSLYWHWWFFHPGWWDGCWCLPPWWGWHGWWAFPWGDLWGLW